MALHRVGGLIAASSFTLAVLTGIVAKYLLGYSAGTAAEAALMMAGGIPSVIVILTRKR